MNSVISQFPALKQPGIFESRSENEQRNYFERAADFIKMEVGEANIISAVVHMDERTPHMHLCFTPITPDNRLCAKEIIGNRDLLIKWQDKFHEHMSTAFPELERGEPAAETKRKHMPVRIYKQAVRLTDEMALIKNEIMTKLINKVRHKSPPVVRSNGRAVCSLKLPIDPNTNIFCALNGFVVTLDLQGFNL